MTDNRTRCSSCGRRVCSAPRYRDLISRALQDGTLLDGIPNVANPPTNANYRYASYRFLYTKMSGRMRADNMRRRRRRIRKKNSGIRRNGVTGDGFRRIEFPDCVELMVKTMFPEENVENYVGFISD